MFVPKKIIDETVRQAPKDGKNLLEPIQSYFKKGFPVRILEISNIENQIELHTKEADLWHCLEGEATFTYGGTIKNERDYINSKGERKKFERTGDKIVRGKTIIMRSGDWLYIPAGTPHRHGAKRSCRLAIIKLRENS